MDQHDIGLIGASVVGVGRALTGVYFLARPGAGAEAWVGDAQTSTRYLARAVGARDLAIGTGVLWALGADEPVVPWVLASVVGDGFDAAFGAGMLEGDHRKKAMGLAGGFGALGAVTIALLLAG